MAVELPIRAGIENPATCDRGLKADVIADVSDFLALKPEWQKLAELCPEYSAALSFGWVEVALATLPSDATPAIVTVRNGADLVCVWPLFTRIDNGVRVATHLSCSSNEEYAGAIIPYSGCYSEIAGLAIKTAKSVADVIKVYNSVSDSPLAKALKNDTSFSHRWSMEAHVIQLGGVESWDVYVKGKSKSFRHARSYERRRLAARGRLEVTTNGEGVVEWLFAMKRQWLARQGLRSAWIEGPDGEAFFANLVTKHLGAFAVGLTLDGAYIAAGICLQSGDRLEYFITTFDPAYAKNSPGDLLTEECVRVAIARGLDFDFRMMGSFYKERWANRTDQFEGFILAANPRGIPTVLAIRAKQAGKNIRRALGRTARAALKRVNAPKAR